MVAISAQKAAIHDKVLVRSIKMKGVVSMIGLEQSPHFEKGKKVKKNTHELLAFSNG